MQYGILALQPGFFSRHNLATSYGVGDKQELYIFLGKQNKNPDIIFL